VARIALCGQNGVFPRRECYNKKNKVLK
jgi:hypothetical protein